MPATASSQFGSIGRHRGGFPPADRPWQRDPRAPLRVPAASCPVPGRGSSSMVMTRRLSTGLTCVTTATTGEPGCCWLPSSPTSIADGVPAFASWSTVGRRPVSGAIAGRSGGLAGRATVAGDWSVSQSAPGAEAPLTCRGSGRWSWQWQNTIRGSQVSSTSRAPATPEPHPDCSTTNPTASKSWATPPTAPVTYAPTWPTGT